MLCSAGEKQRRLAGQPRERLYYNRDGRNWHQIETASLPEIGVLGRLHLQPRNPFSNLLYTYSADRPNVKKSPQIAERNCILRSVVKIAFLP